MKSRILFAISLLVPAIALACGSPAKEHTRIAPPANPEYAATGKTTTGDGAAVPRQGEQSAGKSGGCCSNATCDEKGRIVRKSNGAGGFIDYVYHPHTGKLILILNDGYKNEFHYNDQGELVRAENSDGQLITLDYEGTPRIQRIVEVDRTAGTRRQLAFKYNDAGKPVEILLAGVGKITVQYDDKGEIAKVDSKQGMKMALQVTQAFQNLLSVVQPTGTRF